VLPDISSFDIEYLFNFAVLHPKYKLTYFRAKKWPQPWIDAALVVLREQWSNHYKSDDLSEPGSQSSSSSASVSPFSRICINLTLHIVKTSRDTLFSALDDFGTDDLSDELEEYLNTPTISTKGLDPLVWWHAIGESLLSRMATDFLSAPGKLITVPLCIVP
jgi:hypothetical protein